jgi:hypothetical protein
VMKPGQWMRARIAATSYVGGIVHLLLMTPS